QANIDSHIIAARPRRKGPGVVEVAWSNHGARARKSTVAARIARQHGNAILTRDDDQTSHRQRLSPHVRQVKAAQQYGRSDTDDALRFKINKEFEAIPEADLKVGRVDLKGGIAWIAVKVVSKKAEVKLAFPQGLRI